MPYASTKRQRRGQGMNPPKPPSEAPILIGAKEGGEGGQPSLTVATVLGRFLSDIKGMEDKLATPIKDDLWQSRS